MTQRQRAYAVHLLTATGAVLAMFALLAASVGNWPWMFVWLLAAFAVDGIDGPLARRYDVEVFAPEVDGALLDLIIDYLTYVFIPAYALFWSGMLPGLWGWAGLAAILFGSVIYFADTRMKTADKSFAGFPACWNMVVLVLFATRPPAVVAVAVVALLTAGMFLPLRFVHPVRTRRWRWLTLPMALVWTVTAAWSAWAAFAPPEAVVVALAVSSLYLLTVGVAQQVLTGLQDSDNPDPS